MPAIPGPVECAIRATVTPGMRLQTPSVKPAPFEVDALEPDAIVLLLGEKRARTPVGWDLLEGVPAAVGSGWLPIGSARVDARADTLSGYTNARMYRAAASYIVAVLERACVLEVDRRRPARVRVGQGFR